MTDTSSWEFPSSGPLSGANSALPWIVFSRDRARFQAEFPQWRIAYLRLDMPFAYLLSGGLTRLNAMPSASYPWCRRLERALSPWMSSLAMFGCIVLGAHGPGATHRPQDLPGGLES